MDKFEKDFKPSAGDYIHSAAKAAASMIPVAGGPLAEFINLIEPPLSRRKNEWFRYVLSEIERLKEKTESFTIENLAQNEQFLTMLMQATQVAIRNHQAEKIEALKNALLHSILNDPPVDESMQMVFLHLIDVMTPWHILVLSFLHSPREWLSSHGIRVESYMMGSPMDLLQKAFPELVRNASLTAQVLLDLRTNGLAHTDIMNTSMTENGMYAQRSTPTGELFLQYISDI